MSIYNNNYNNIHLHCSVWNRGECSIYTALLRCLIMSLDRSPVRSAGSVGSAAGSASRHNKRQYVHNRGTVHHRVQGVPPCEETRREVDHVHCKQQCDAAEQEDEADADQYSDSTL